MAGKKKPGREARRCAAFGVQLLVLGLVCFVVPRALRGSMLGAAFSGWSAVGWPLLALGGAMLVVGLVLNRRAAVRLPALAVEAPSARQRGRRTFEPTHREPATATVVDKVVTGADHPPKPAPDARPEAWGRAVFDAIEWRRFEAVVEKLFQQAGFETRSQSHGADGGVDIWLYSRHQPGEPVSLVQCKHWKTRVGVDKVRELRGVMAARQVGRGQFATTSTFTPDARAFAQENGINPLDVDALLALIARRSSEQQADLLAVALEGDYRRPTCASCGVKMTERQPRGGGAKFWGCVNYPRCKSRLNMRA